MSSNRALFLAGACGALAVVANILAWITGVHLLTLGALVALVPGTVLLVIAYVQLIREWLARRSQRRSQPRIDVYLFALRGDDDDAAEDDDPELEAPGGRGWRASGGDDVLV